MYRLVEGRRAEEFDVKIRRDRAVRFTFAITLHQKNRRRPIRVAIEQSANDTAIQHPRKRLMMRFGVPDGDDLIPIRKARDMQSLLIRRATAEADASG